MSWKKLLSSQNGFTLVEILTAFGLLTVLTLAVMKISDNSNKVTKDLENKDEINQIHNELTMILSNPTNCERTLRDVVPSPNWIRLGSIFAFTQGQEQPVYSIGATRTDQERRSDVTIEEIRVIGVIGSSPSNTTLDLEVKYEKPGVLFEEGADSKNFNRIGSKTVTRVIKIGASFCPRTIYFNPSPNPNTCPAGLNPVQINSGPSLPWIVCEDCTTNVTPASPIQSCAALSSGGSGLNLDQVSDLTCYKMGGTMEDNKCNIPDNSMLSCQSFKGTWIEASKTCNLNISNTEDACTALGGTFDPITLLCNLGSDQLNCKSIGGTWVIDQTTKVGSCKIKTDTQENVNCEFEKEIFKQSKEEGAEKIFENCEKRPRWLRIIKKIQEYKTPQLQPIQIPNDAYFLDLNNVPNFKNIISNSLTLFLVGAGGGGGCGGNTNWGEGGRAGEKLIVPLDSIQIRPRDLMTISIGWGGIGGDGAGACNDRKKLATFGGDTSVEFLRQNVGAIRKVVARGGAQGRNDAIIESPDAQNLCPGEPLGELGMGGYNFSGGSCNLNKSGPGGLGGYGSGGGGGYNESGGRGGAGIVILTWLEWCEVGVNCP